MITVPADVLIDAALSELKHPNEILRQRGWNTDIIVECIPSADKDIKTFEVRLIIKLPEFIIPLENRA